MSALRSKITQVMRVEPLRSHWREGEHVWMPTYMVATRLKFPTVVVRRELIKMEADGLVKRNAQYSGCNSIAWELVK